MNNSALPGKKSSLNYNSALIIDNDEMELFLNKRALIANNITSRIYTETSVRSALHFMQSTIEMPELIFIDYSMLDFLKNLAKFPIHTTRKCKVFLLSYSPISVEEIMEEAETRHLDLKYLPKPINIDFLIAKN